MTVMGSDELITVGRIVGPHGVKGTLKLQPLTDYPDRFHEMPQLQVYSKEGNLICSLSVRNVRTLESKGYLIIDTDEINDRDSAEALRGALIKIPESEKHALSEGEYWVDDIIGLKVVNSETGEELGHVINVLEVGENDVYEVRSTDGKEKHIPAVSQFIKKIDLDNKTIEVEIIEGLFD